MRGEESSPFATVRIFSKTLHQRRGIEVSKAMKRRFKDASENEFAVNRCKTIGPRPRKPSINANPVEALEAFRSHSIKIGIRHDEIGCHRRRLSVAVTNFGQNIL